MDSCHWIWVVVAFMMAWIKTVASGVDPGAFPVKPGRRGGMSAVLSWVTAALGALVLDVASVAPSWLALRAHETRFVRH